MTNVEAMNAFFGANEGRKITTDEFKALGKEEREEIGDMCRVALGAGEVGTRDS